MTSRSNTHADQPGSVFLWEALSLGHDACRAASRDVHRIMRALDQFQELDGAGNAVRIEVTQEQVTSLLLPLALATQNLARAQQRRVLVGVTGGAGTGKTMLSVLLCRVLHVLSGQEIAVPLGIDAYHFPNAYLDTQTEIDAGNEVLLRQIKGRPCTFDVESLVADLRRLRSSEEHEIALPAYDRGQHDPVPGALCVHPHHRIVVVEGLHLLRPEPSWTDARACLDFCTLLELPLETCRRRVVSRKIAGGRLPADVQAHFERVDRPTLEELHDPALRARADLVIHLEEAAEEGSARRTRLHGCERRENAVESVELRAIPPGAVQLLAVGLNPALQKTLVCDRWERGQVNRAREVLLSVGGKGQQFSRAASHLIPGMVTLILKVNAYELRSLAGRHGGRSQPVTAQGMATIPEIALAVFAAHQLRWLAVTAGADTAWLFERPCVGSAPGQPCTWQFYEFRLPTVEGVVNPIGAGDTVGAVFLAQLAAGTPAHAAFACGLAAGSASCRQLGGADFALNDLHDVLAKIRISRHTRWWTNDERAGVTHLA